MTLTCGTPRPLVLYQGWHVTPHEIRGKRFWRVGRPGARRAFRRFSELQDAWLCACEIAEQTHGTAYLQDHLGRFRGVKDYRPRPPEDGE